MSAIRLAVAALLSLTLASASFVAPGAVAEEAGSVNDGAMNNVELDRLIRRIEGIEGEVEGQPGFWRFVYRGYQVYVITDERADRMRIMAPVAAAEEMEKDALYRVLQANFDTALDSRYAIAQGALWSAFVHPLAALDEAAFYAGFAQTVTLAATYGTTYSSSGLQFEGGDKPAE